jgi:hypothetical protein
MKTFILFYFSFCFTLDNTYLICYPNNAENSERLHLELINIINKNRYKGGKRMIKNLIKLKPGDRFLVSGRKYRVLVKYSIDRVSVRSEKEKKILSFSGKKQVIPLGKENDN